MLELRHTIKQDNRQWFIQTFEICIREFIFTSKLHGKKYYIFPKAWVKPVEYHGKYFSIQNNYWRIILMEIWIISISLLNSNYSEIILFLSSKNLKIFHFYNIFISNTGCEIFMVKSAVLRDHSTGINMRFFLVLTLNFCLIRYITSSGQLTRFKSSSAVSLNPKVCTVHYCYIKSYSRTVSAFNLGLTYHRPLVKPFFVCWQISLFVSLKMIILIVSR